MVGPLARYPVTQIGFVVADLEEALARFGGAWERFEVHPDLFADVSYHRGAVVFDHAVALSSGGIPQLELIQPHGGPNLWQEWFDAGQGGIHHCAVEVESALGVVEAMESAGHPAVFSGRFGGTGEFAYFDTTRVCGVYVEALTFPREWSA